MENKTTESAIRQDLDFSGLFELVGISKEIQEKSAQHEKLRQAFGLDTIIEEKIDKHFTNKYVYWLENKVIELSKCG